MKIDNRAHADHCKMDVKQRHDHSDGVSYYPMVGQNLLRMVIFFCFCDLKISRTV